MTGVAGSLRWHQTSVSPAQERRCWRTPHSVQGCGPSSVDRHTRHETSVITYPRWGKNDGKMAGTLAGEVTGQQDEGPSLIAVIHHLIDGEGRHMASFSSGQGQHTQQRRKGEEVTQQQRPLMAGAAMAVQKAAEPTTLGAGGRRRPLGTIIQYIVHTQSLSICG
ncbi:hypothetical protein LY76DRAFT_62800 [Colletotrichum caudatum]|nr:hypothetical protein LY76DRAFT_62800 [Colletotrichum caudatum]